MANWPYMETELDPVIHAEILLEVARIEARVVILAILLALGFGVWFGFGSEVFSAVALFGLAMVVGLLVDSALRRRASEKLRGINPLDG